MNVCIVARNEQEIPPKGYGGTERILFSLIKKLYEDKRVNKLYIFAKKGHTLMKYASGKEDVIYFPYPEDIKDNNIKDYVKDTINEAKLDIDIIHDNSEMIIAHKDEFKCPVLFTLHYMSKDHYNYENIIYPSKYCRTCMNGNPNEDNIINHCLPDDEYTTPLNRKDNDLLYLGVVKYNKGVHHAISIAEKLGVGLVIAGPQDPDDPNLNYFNSYIKPKLNEKIRYVGEVKGLRKRYFLVSSKVMLFPTKVETFGIVALEAMASGLPVLMFDNCTGSEILPKELLAFDEEDMLNKTKYLLEHFKEEDSTKLINYITPKFSEDRMEKEYYKAYKSLITNGKLNPVKNAKPAISLCMIVKNEESRLGKCLTSVKDIVDEIVIVDTGSTDNTKKVAEEFNAKIYDFEWVYDFSKARNEALKHATSDYILWLDADDILKDEDIKKFKKLKNELKTTNPDLVWMYYDYRHDSNGNSTYSFQNERLFRNHRGIKWNCVVHEVLDLKGKVNKDIKTDIHITHTSNHDNTNKYVDFFSKNEELGHVFNSREKYFYCMEVYKHENKQKAYQLALDVINHNDGTTNSYEMHSTYSMKGMMEMNWGMYNDAILSLNNSIAYHQPLPYLLFNLGECHRFIGQYNHAKYYYNILLNELPFPENFSNNSVYTNYDKDLHEFKCKAYVSLVFMAYYNYNDKDLARAYNDALLLYDPENEAGLYNKEVL